METGSATERGGRDAGHRTARVPGCVPARRFEREHAGVEEPVAYPDTFRVQHIPPR